MLEATSPQPAPNREQPWNHWPDTQTPMVSLMTTPPTMIRDQGQALLLLLLLLLLQSMPTSRPLQRKNLPRHQQRAPQKPLGTSDRSRHPSQRNQQLNQLLDQADPCMRTLSWRAKPHLRSQLRTEPRLHPKGKQPSRPEDREKVARRRTVSRKRRRMCTTTKTSTRATVPSGPCLYWTPFRNTCWTVWQRRRHWRWSLRLVSLLFMYRCGCC